MEISKFVSPKIPTRLPGDMGENRFDELEGKAKELCKRKDRLGVWMGLMLVCGLRISEIQTAKVHDERFIKVLGKGNKERKVPALPWVLEAMANIDRDGKKGWAKGRNTIYRHVRKLGIKPHSLRHTYASQLMREGGKIEKIKDCLGHIDISTTNIYARTDVPYEYALLLDRDSRKNRAESVFP
jgi:site-specific recombinase XerD